MDAQSSDLMLIPLIVLAFAIVFPLFWTLIIGLISIISGWQRLAQRYRATVPPSGQKWTWQFGMIGWASYRGVLTLTANDAGLFMENMWLFRFGHPRLFIPWQEFREAKVNHFFFQRQVKARIGFPPMATVRLPAAVFEETAGRNILVNQP